MRQEIATIADELCEVIRKADRGLKRGGRRQEELRWTANTTFFLLTAGKLPANRPENNKGPLQARAALCFLNRKPVISSPAPSPS
jgi:hypothetical protein